MSMTDITVHHRKQSGGTDVFTVSRADEDFRFEGWIEDSTYCLEFEEGFGYRGESIGSPDEDVWKALIQSPKLDRAMPNGVDRITRKG